jgi:hypothetical protein
MGLDDMAKKALASAVHNIRKGASRHYCPATKGNHKMGHSDMGGGWKVLHCTECGWFDPKKHQHFLG